MPTINGDNITKQVITGSGQTWTVARNATILTTGDALEEGNTSHDNVININGVVRAEPAAGVVAFVAHGANTVINIGDTGLLSSFNGILTFGANMEISNKGTISASTTGGNGVALQLGGMQGHLVNSGLIAGNLAVYVTNISSSIVNEEDGRIVGYANSAVYAAGPFALQLVNHGLITKAGGGMAVHGGAGVDKIRNDGTIDGDIRLGDGNDVVDTRRGMIDGFIHGEVGDDTLIVDKESHKLTELVGGGFDTVQSSVSYELSINVEALVLTGNRNLKGAGSDDANVITGNGGNNAILGLVGADTLGGGKGNDRLTGGTQSDTFVFRRRDGVDTVLDYIDEEDEIAIIGFNNIENFDQLSRRVSQHGDDVWIVLGGGDKVILKDVDQAALEETDFSYEL